MVFAILLAFAAAPSASAQGVAFTGGFAPVGGSFSTPAGVAVDAQGDIFVGLLGAHAVEEIPASCLAGANNASCVRTIGGGFDRPIAVAVDAAGDVFVANVGVGVVEVSASCIAGANDQTCEALIGASSPYGVAVDAAGDVYVADNGRGFSVKEVPASCIAGANNASCMLTLYSNGYLFYGLTLDAQGNLFAANVLGGSHPGSVVELEAVDGVVPASPVAKTIGGGFGHPSNLAFDASGDLFVSDPELNAVWEVPASCIAGANNASCTVTAAAVPYASGVAVGPSGQLVVSESLAGIVLEQNPQIQSVSLGAAVNVCPAGATTPAPCSQTVTLTYTVAAGTTIDPTKFLTLGGGNLDFKATPNDTSTTLCGGYYAKASTCTVDVTFAPRFPGPRYGAINFTGHTGQIIATTYVSGVGVGPLPAFNPAPVVTLGSGFDFPEGVAVDAKGDVFVADQLNGEVKEIDAVTGGNIVTLGGGFAVPGAVAVDGAGDVFVADDAFATIEEIPASCIAGANNASCVVPLGGGFRDPEAVAVDGAGNVYVADAGNHAVKEIVAAGGYATVTTLATDEFTVPGVAVDGSGDVFYTEAAGSVYEILAVGGAIPSNPTINKIFSGLRRGAAKLAVDASGNVYVADVSDGIVQIQAAGGYSTSSVIYSPGGLGTIGVALDGSGNVYVADDSLTSVVELVQSKPATLSFPDIVIDPTSAPQSVTVQNIGNASLTGTIAELGGTVATNWTLVAGGGAPADCTTSSSSAFSLAIGAECNLSVEFAPVVGGYLSSHLILTDNSLNATAATQSVPLTGFGLPQPQTINFTTVPTQVVNATVTLSATTSGDLPVVFSSTTPTYCTVTGSSATMLKAGQCTLKAVQSGNPNWAYVSTTQNVRVNQ